MARKSFTTIDSTPLLLLFALVRPRLSEVALTR
jgi:hypothetical protein